MPFPQQNPRSFTAADVQSLSPNQNGCYGIYSGNTCLYIGKGDLRTRMMAHVNGDNPCITKGRPTHWLGAVTNDMDNEEKRLILEQRPTCNQRVG